MPIDETTDALLRVSARLRSDTARLRSDTARLRSDTARLRSGTVLAAERSAEMRRVITRDIAAQRARLECGKQRLLISQ